ncbi:hypothetical protein [Pseudomonas sp. Irchel s3a10]|uniref:hypothetical protein n=1 Tax=Pseudomonas sp. Irchel s3a10 TaxID=2009045 RepID=UPI001179913C|nr:hypothetical protein [Pseudomonas sp. Irchel s3a10]
MKKPMSDHGFFYACHNPIVGVSLLAMAAAHSKHHGLTHRYREQAHSYRRNLQSVTAAQAE